MLLDLKTNIWKDSIIKYREFQIIELELKVNDVQLMNYTQENQIETLNNDIELIEEKNRKLKVGKKFWTGIGGALGIVFGMLISSG